MSWKWTKEEKDFLWKIAHSKMDDGKLLPDPLVVHFYNQKFHDRKRSVKAIDHQLRKLNKEKENLMKIEKKVMGSNHEKIQKEVKKMTEKQFPTMEKVRKKHPRHYPTQNSGMGWTPSDDKYLLANWSANDAKRNSTAKHLGRTLHACRSRLLKIRKNPEYMNSILVQSHEVTMQDKGVYLGSAEMNPVNFNDTKKEVKVSNSARKPGLLERLLDWLIHRGERKHEKKIQKAEAKLLRLRGE